MVLTQLHPADVRAAIQKRFGTIGAFERAKRLPTKSVNDVLRGRTNRRVAGIINDFLAEVAPSNFSDNNAVVTPTHSLNAEAK
ncbi:MAG: hypothetical protein ACT6Q7_01870 [Blastomonas fulva]|uniref:hypothetical protein n=1 Tax=Blastomonas fulva TaxID=1550728 RepID=UPI004034CA37